ncbi:MAG: Gmad2 immunoglobulin-like domain-containing protein [Chloroflexota bacterium]|nr:Gmad2 immunoglobulin-like domain-containing protein [Chloroflexota bacterium]
MKTGRIKSNMTRGMAVLVLPLLLLACNASGGTSTNSSIAVPTTVASIELKQDVIQNGDTLRIIAPLPGAVVTRTLTVQAEGTAFENTFNVDLTVGGNRVANTVVTTDSPVGELDTFTATLEFAPVSAATEAEVSVYTTSAKDGHVDQFTSVPVTLVPESAEQTTVTVTTNEAEIHLSPDRGGAGKQVLIVGDNFPADTDVQIHLGGLNTAATEHVYATLQSNGSGSIRGTFIMPEYWPNGEKILVSQVTVLATTPDFLYKATAEFNYEAEPASTAPEGDTPK